MPPQRFLTTLAVASALALAACGEEIQPTYDIQVVAPELEGMTAAQYLAGAERVVLELNSNILSDRPYSPGQTIVLEAKGIDVGVGRGVFRLRVLGAGGTVIAFGQTPEVELELISSSLRIFVQRPRSVGRSFSLPDPRTAHIAVATRATPTQQGPLSMFVPFFGFGRIRVPDPAGVERQGIERFSEALFTVNPITHSLTDLGLGAGMNGTDMPAARIDSAAIARTDESVLVFGGISRTSDTAMPVVTSQADIYQVRRDGFSSFRRGLLNAKGSPDPAVARSETALTGGEIAYAFGGKGADGMPLDSVVELDTRNNDIKFAVVAAKMAAARVGHTATAALGEGGTEILVFGGAAAGQPAAELFVPRSGQFDTTKGDPGGGRRDHGAVTLPDGRILIVGGIGDDGMARADAVVYDPRTRMFDRAPLMLRTARSAFTAFVIGDDVVISGGRDAGGAFLGTAEVFHARTLERRGDDIPVRPRGRAKACVIPTQGIVFLVGGDEASPTLGMVGSVAVEIYQPGQM